MSISKKYAKSKKITYGIIVFTLFTFLFFTRVDFKLNHFFHDIGSSIENLLIPNIKIDNSDILTGINQELIEENKELKNLLSLELEEYHVTYAKIIKRDITWYDELVINRGSNHGIKLDMAVVANGRLIGRIITVNQYSSTVKLITSNQKDMKIAVDIKNSDKTYHAILDRYQEGFLYVSYNKKEEVAVGDKVYTNGLGGIYPSGIYIGEVSKIENDSLGLQKQALVSIGTDYDTIRYIEVLSKEKVS